MGTDKVIETYFSQKFNSLVSKPANDKVLVSFNGSLNQEQVTKLESEIETRIIEAGIPKGPLKKIFFISVETLQNMLIHGNRDDHGKQYNFFILAKNGIATHITSANLVRNQNIIDLEGQITKINNFQDPSELKIFYMEHLENNQLSVKGGAGLGFITIAMKSGNKLAYGFEKISDETSLFWLTSSVSLG